MAENKSASFEDALKRLQAIVDRLEGGDVSLDESVKLFNEGRTLVTDCEKMLAVAEETLKQPSAAPAAAQAQPSSFEDERSDDEIPF